MPSVPTGLRRQIGGQPVQVAAETGGVGGRQALGELGRR